MKRVPRISKTCDYCQNVFQVKAHDAEVRPARYCSLSCRAKGIWGNAIERFWAQVKITDECWEWTGSIVAAGYGQISINGKARLAHRVSFEWNIANGPADPSMCVCHHCDNRLCVRPDHLFIGTDKENAADKVAKGRCNAPKGTSHHNAILNDNIVIIAREMRSNGDGDTKIARALGVTKSAVYRAVRGETWKHVKNHHENSLLPAQILEMEE